MYKAPQQNVSPVERRSRQIYVSRAKPRAAGRKTWDSRQIYVSRAKPRAAGRKTWDSRQIYVSRAKPRAAGRKVWDIVVRSMSHAPNHEQLAGRCGTWSSNLCLTRQTTSSWQEDVGQSSNLCLTRQTTSSWQKDAGQTRQIYIVV
jgi:hypothetical protein